MEDNFFHRLGVGGGVSGGNACDGEQKGVADEASLACPLLTSCCVSQFLTGHDKYWSVARRLGTPDIHCCSFFVF